MIYTGKELTAERKAALTAGILLLIMTLAAFFSYGFVHGKLVVQGNASATFANILSSKLLFKAGIFGWVIILTCDTLVAWAFYNFLKPINKNLALLCSWLRMIYAAILAIAIEKLLFILLISNNKGYLSLFKIDQLQAQVMLYLKGFDSIWSIGLIIFGGHLLLVGWLAFKSDNIPNVFSILLLLASTGYILIHLCNTFLPEYHEFIKLLEFVFIVPMIAGELGFGLWLLIRGGKVLRKA